MALTIPLVWSDHHRRHEPGGEIWVGVRTPGTELPARADAIRVVVEAAGAPLVEAVGHPDDVALRNHDPELVGYLAGAWADWLSSGLAEDPGQDRVVPYLFAHPGLIGDLPERVPAATSARAGRFGYDTMTLIGPGTWEAARAAVDASLTAADLVAAGAPAAYACCRPPGHHATASAFGGSCYLNNAAAAAAQLADSLRGTIAVLDIDAHHGNGTQSIFYSDPAVLTGSVHVDPGTRLVPALRRLRERTRRGCRGKGRTSTSPSPPVPATGPGSRRCPSWPDGLGPAAPPASSSRSASMPPGAIRRARSRSRRTATGPPAGRSASSACRP